MSHGYDYEQDPQSGSDGAAGRGRRRRRDSEQGEQQQGIPEQYRPDDFSEPGYPRPEYAQPDYGQSEYSQQEYGQAQYPAPDFPGSDFPGSNYPAPDYPQPDYPQAEYADEGYPQPGRERPESPHRAPYDAQWEHSGLGWDPQAWREASAADPHWAERTWVEPERAEWAGFEATRTEADPDFESFEHERFEPGPGPGDAGVEHFAREPFGPDGFDRESYGTGSYGTDSYGTESFDTDRYDADRYDADRYDTDSFGPGPGLAPDAAAPAEPPSQRSTDLAAELSAGRGAFGAAGLAVVAGISAVVGKPFLALVIGLSQIGLAIGWLRTVGSPNRHRTTVLVGLTGLAASAIAYRLDSEHAPGAIATAVGVGFVLLAADQLLHRDRDSVPGPRRLEALAAAVTGAALAALPAGFLVAQRQDSKLTAACGLAAAVAILCSALVGGGTRAIGVAAAAAAGAVVGGITAVSLSSTAGIGGGVIGGVAVGLLAAAAARVTDRLGAEGGDVRISSQTLPLAFAAVGAAIAVSVLR